MSGKKLLNAALEFHDSTIASMLQQGKSVEVLLNEAYVHRSEGTPGIDSGSGWGQVVRMSFGAARVLEKPQTLPSDISEGDMQVNGLLYENCVPLPFAATGEVEFFGVTCEGEKFRVVASSVELSEQSEARYIEEFHSNQ